MSKRRGGGGNRGGISWIKKEEPKFIRQFKERIAYKEQATVETKKKVVDKDLIIEKEEDLPQIVQLKSGDLGEKEYLALKSKEEIENSASSFGKILFKKPSKKVEQSEPETLTKAADSKPSEIDLIFNLNKEGKEIIQEEEKEKEEIPVTNSSENKEIVEKKKFLEEEQDQQLKYGLQEPPVKKRFIDGKTNKTTSLSAAQVFSREAKSGNKKLLSFYNEEDEENEEEDSDN